jgi:phosphohistidine phosphatase
VNRHGDHPVRAYVDAMTHDLYLVRHAEAIPRGTLEPDEYRWLTPKGRRAFYKVARRLFRRLHRGQIEAILTSPLPRAVMTAELLCRALRLRGPVEVHAELSPDAPVEAAAALLGSQDRCVAAVGHEPQLHQLLRGFIGEGAGGLEKGAIAALRPHDKVPGATARLHFLLEP